MKSIILSLLLFTSQARATCTDPVKHLELGEPAPCSGFLFTEQAEVNARLRVYERDYYKTLYEKMGEVNSLNEKRLELQLEKNQKLTEYVDKKKDRDELKFLGSFVLGSLITAYIASNVSH